jgi:methionyl-tRNA synthetase
MNNMNNTDNVEIKTANTENNTADEVVVVASAINFDDFLKVKMAVGKVLSAEKLEKSPKLLKLSVDFGEADPRQVLSGIAKTFTPEDLIGKSFAFVINLEPRQIMGMESQAMILAASDEQGLVLFSPTRDIVAGSNLG